AEAGLQVGDVIVKVDGVAVSGPEKFTAAVSDKKPGDAVVLVIKRAGKEQEVKAKLAADQAADARALQWDSRGLTPWGKDVYRLAVVRIEYPDVKHNPQMTAWDWEQALFSRAVYNDKSATGQQVYGSMNDFYVEQSCGTFHVEGKVFDHVLVGRKRADY